MSEDFIRPPDIRIAVGFAGVVRIFDVEVVAVGLNLLDGDSPCLRRFDTVGEGIQCPASLLGIGIGFFVEMREISFFIEERNPACRGILLKNRRYMI